MKMKTQADIVEEKFYDLINRGMTDKLEIMTVVSQELNVKRPTVRRVKQELIEKLENYIKILK